MRFGASYEQVFGTPEGIEPVGFFSTREVELDIPGPNGITTVTVPVRVHFSGEDVRAAYRRAVEMKRPRHAVQRAIERHLS